MFDQKGKKTFTEKPLIEAPSNAALQAMTVKELSQLARLPDLPMLLFFQLLWPSKPPCALAPFFS